MYVQTFSRKQDKDSLGQSESLAYALPVLAVNFLMGPLAILQGVYAKHFGLPLSTIATVLLLSRLFDAVTDPAVGYLSDRYHARRGNRKPFVVCGGVLFIIASYFLYVPPDEVSTVYFLGWFLAFYLAFTLFEVPHLAWGTDLCITSRGKNRIYSWRAAGMLIGSLLFFTVPLLPVFETSNITPDTLRWSTLLAGCLMVPLLYICVTKVPASKVSAMHQSPEGGDERKKDMGNSIRSIVGNPSLLWFLAAFFCAGTGLGMWFALLYLYVDVFLGQGEQFAKVYIASYGVGVLTLVVWSKLAALFNKQSVWNAAMVIMACGIFSMGFLSPGIGTASISLLLCMTLIFSGVAAWMSLSPSLLSDIIDYGTFKFGCDKAGIYFSLYTLITKANFAIGGALGLGLAGWYGFDATTVVQSEAGEFGLRLAMAWLPVPMLLLSVLFVWLIPINSRRHIIISRRLVQRSARQSNLKSKVIPKVLQPSESARAPRSNLAAVGGCGNC